MAIDFEITEEDDDAVRAIDDGLTASNPHHSPKHPLLVLAKSHKGQLLGGLKGYTQHGWLYISQIWTEQPKQGLGKQLMQLAEEEARRRGCHSAHLNTFSFQARNFYEKLGYKAFGELADFPPGHERIFLQKRLTIPVTPQKL